MGTDRTRPAVTAQEEARELFLLRLLSGGYYQQEDPWQEDARNAGIEFRQGRFRVISARVETWGTLYTGTMEERREVAFILRNLMEHQIADCYGVSYGGKFALVLNPGEESAEDTAGLRTKVLEQAEVLEREYRLTVSFAISRLYDSPMELALAWEDTELVFDYQDVISEDFVVSAYEELTWSHMQQSSTAYVDINTRLMAAVRRNDYEGMRLVFHELLDNEFAAVRPTIQIFRFRIYGVVDQLLYLMEYLRGAVGNERMDRIDPGPRLVKKQPVPALLAEIDRILDELVELTGDQPERSFPEWVEQVHRYVEQNYTDPNLCVASVADQFHVSPTYCSKIFRDRYGIRLFDFIQLQRLEAAKKLLPTGRSAKDVAEIVGYSSALTMSRAFKRYEGMAPTEYR